MAESTIPSKNTPRNDIAADRIRSIVDYCPKTGIFRWKKRSDVGAWWNGRYAGKEAGGIDKEGYIAIGIDDKRYPAHRLAWLYMTGEWPRHDVDHRDDPRTDNRWSNLREATRQQNLRNMRMRSTNKSGYKWVSWSKVMNKWRAQIRDGKKNLDLGYFSDPREAHEVALDAAKRIHKQFARAK